MSPLNYTVIRAHFHYRCSQNYSDYYRNIYGNLKKECHQSNSSLTLFILCFASFQTDKLHSKYECREVVNHNCTVCCSYVGMSTRALLALNYLYLLMCTINMIYHAKYHAYCQYHYIPTPQLSAIVWTKWKCTCMVSVALIDGFCFLSPTSGTNTTVECFFQLYNHAMDCTSWAISQDPWRTEWQHGVAIRDTHEF